MCKRGERDRWRERQVEREREREKERERERERESLKIHFTIKTKCDQTMGNLLEHHDWKGANYTDKCTVK